MGPSNVFCCGGGGVLPGRPYAGDRLNSPDEMAGPLIPHNQLRDLRLSDSSFCSPPLASVLFCFSSEFIFGPGEAAIEGCS